MRILCVSFACVSLLFSGPAVSSLGRAQGTPAPAPKQPSTSLPTAAAPAPSGGAHVLFSRSTDPTAATVADSKASSARGAENVSVTVTDTERAAPTFTSYNLDIHLAPAQASLAVEARLTLRNDGSEPLRQLPLQLSSTLHIERVSIDGRALPLVRHLVASDADHTGELEETVVALPQPVPPGASLTLAVAYSGAIEPTAARLDRLETPAEVASASDWDRISDAFTGLRGFGDVVWYPVCSEPALLGDGVKLFTEIGRQRARNQDATVAIRLVDEFTGAVPTVAVLAGHALAPGTPQSMPSASFPGVLDLELPPTRLGFRVPSLFLADRTESDATGTVRVYSQAEHTADAQGYLAAAALLEPLMAEWLGAHARQPLAIVDLPVDGAQPSEQGEALLASLIKAEPEQIARLLSQELPHAWFRSPRVWLNEGVPALLATLYVEQTQGGDAALERLETSRGALALVEPASPGAGAGEDLLHASDAIYYRAKALDVLWMLRDLAGDKALSAALRAYDPLADTQPDSFEKLVEQASGKDLKWFFDAWVYHDQGLPDLSIVGVFSSRTSQPDQWLVSVDIANDGYAEAEVPVTVHSATTAVTERVRVAGRTKTSRRLLIVGEPTSIDVNDGSVPEVQASKHKRVIE